MAASLRLQRVEAGLEPLLEGLGLRLQQALLLLRRPPRDGERDDRCNGADDADAHEHHPGRDAAPRGRTVLLSTHRSTGLDQVDAVLQVADGRLAVPDRAGHPV